MSGILEILDYLNLEDVDRLIDLLDEVRQKYIATKQGMQLHTLQLKLMGLRARLVSEMRGEDYGDGGEG